LGANGIILLIGIAIATLIMWLISYLTKGPKKKREEALRTYMSPDENVIHEQHSGIFYLGGHPPFGSPFMDGSMVVTNKRIIFLKNAEIGIFSIPYESTTKISIETKESLTATRVILTGILAPLWKKKKSFILIGMKNDIGEISNVCFGFGPASGFDSYSSWSTERWFQAISEQRYNWFKDEKIRS
jgi:hypothetical protein